MKKIVVLAAAMLASVVLAEAAAQSPAAGASFKAKTIERYCDKLREGPEAYAQFVYRLQTVHGYTYTDFVQGPDGGPLKADCRTQPARIAEAAPRAERSQAVALR